MRVAALYDIHGNLPALEAVLEDVRGANVDQIVVGGDVVPGPMPRETLARLLDLDLPTHFIHGNGELAILAQMAGRADRIGHLLGHDDRRASSRKYYRNLSLDCHTAAARIRAGARGLA